MKEVTYKPLLVSAAIFLFLPLFMAQISILSAKTISTTSPEATPKREMGTFEYIWQNDFCPSSTCSGCHYKIFKEYSESMHSQSFTNPVFQSQYFKEVIPLFDQNKNILSEAKKCIACHSPLTFIKNNELIFEEGQVDLLNSGVTCDFCHSVSGYTDEKPGNGNYITTPGEQELGPFICKTYWHHVYSELHTKSEFCAICHNQVNQYGLEIKSTYTEWLLSPYAKEGIQCEDCHMNVKGFLTAGKASYESGTAASGNLLFPDYRRKLYTHRFPGAHSKSQVMGALTLGIDNEKTDKSSETEIKINIHVDNSRTGHKMPSGSADLRLLWLEVKAIVGDKIIPIPAIYENEVDSYEISGLGPFDREIIRNDIPHGSRVYRAIYLDKTGKQTLSSYEAVEIAFDNRLDAAEIRKETYLFTIPKDVPGKITLIAQLQYLPYPSSFAKKFGLPSQEGVVIARAEKELLLD